MMKTKFDRIEAHIRKLFEENLPQIFTGHQPHRTLVDQLLHVMQNNMLEDGAGKSFAPDLYLLAVSPADMIEWQLHHDILDEIADSIHKTGLSEGLLFLKPPKVELVSEPQIASGGFSISAHFSQTDPNLPDTAAMNQEGEDEVESGMPENASLIVGGKTNFSLEKPVIDIGRHSGNDLVLLDPHVSRHHAQLRAIKNHFVIFDVGSTAGLFLNGKRISQATLHAGDVIRVGTVNLIYNQEPTNAFPTSVLPVEHDYDDTGDDVQ